MANPGEVFMKVAQVKAFFWFLCRTCLYSLFWQSILFCRILFCNASIMMLDNGQNGPSLSLSLYWPMEEREKELVGTQKFGAFFQHHNAALQKKNLEFSMSNKIHTTKFQMNHWHAEKKFTFNYWILLVNFFFSFFHKIKREVLIKMAKLLP